MAADEVLVAEVQARRRDGAGHHVPRVAEPVGVVGVAGGAVGDHERRLAGAAGPAGALRVVGRRGRDVAQAHGVQAGDVHAELHGGRAVQQRQRPLPETVLPLLADVLRHLRRVFPCGEAVQGAGEVAVQVPEEGVDPGHLLAVEVLAQRIVRSACAVTGQPADGGGLHAVARQLPARPRIVRLDDDAQQPHLLERVEEIGDRLMRVLHRTQPREGAAQVAPERPAGREVEIPAVATRGAGPGKRRADYGRPFAVGHRPAGLGTQELAGLAFHPLEALGGEGGDVDGERAAELVEQDVGELLAHLRPGSRERHVPGPALPVLLPDLLVGGDGGEVRIAHGEQAGLFEVRQRDPPPALQVRVEAVLHDVAERPLRLLPCGVPGLGVLGEVGHGEPQPLGDLLRHHLMGETPRVGGHRGVERAAELDHLHVVVEVPGLERGVLAVVHEGEELAGVLAELLRRQGLQRADDARGHHGDRRGPALLVQGGQLGEVTPANLLVRDAAPQAERERGGHEPRLHPLPVGHLGTIRGEPDLPREVLLLGGRHRPAAVLQFHQPVVRQAVIGHRVGRPWQVGGHVEVAGDGVTA